MKNFLITVIAILSVCIIHLFLKNQITRKPDVIKHIDQYIINLFLDIDLELSARKKIKVYKLKSIEIIDNHSKLMTNFDLKKHNLYFNSIDFSINKNNQCGISILNLSGSAENANIFFKNKLNMKPLLHIDVVNDFDPIRIISHWNAISE